MDATTELAVQSTATPAWAIARGELLPADYQAATPWHQQRTPGSKLP